MTPTKADLVPSRASLSGAERALLDERLARARRVIANGGGRTPRIPRRTEQGPAPLSFSQERLWFLDQLEPGRAVYNVCQALRMNGQLNVSALERALNQIISRHEVLRTNFVVQEGRPVQVVAPERKISLRLVEPSSAGADAASVVKRCLDEESRWPFDLEKDALIRALVVRISATAHTLVLTMHHIVSDGWSIGVLLDELTRLYVAYDTGGTADLPELPIQFGDYAAWQRERLQGAEVDRLLTFWRKELAGAPPVLDLPTDFPRSAATTARGAVRTVQLSRSLTDAVNALARKEEATLFMTLLAAFQTLLHRWTGQSDLVLGSVVAGRPRTELEKLIGFFVNTLVFRGDLAGDPTFRELLGRTRETALGVHAHQDLPFEKLVNELRPDRTLSRNPLFQVMFVVQNMPLGATALPQLQLDPIDVDTGAAKFDLTLSLHELPHGLRASMEYNADLFEEATIRRLLWAYERILESVSADPDRPISRLEIVSPDERALLLNEWSHAAPRAVPETSVAHVFAEQVKSTPGAVAVAFGSESLTYRELDARSNQLARWLQAAGVGPRTLVGVIMERSTELIVALVGILKAGGAYVSLDPSYPTERIAFMLRDTGTPVILTQERLKRTVEEFVEAGAKLAEGEIPLQVQRTIVCLDSEWRTIAQQSAAAVTCEAGPDDLAYVSYTSGSTGRPKGVCVPHRGVVRLVKNTDYARFGTDEIFLQFAPVAFDASTFEIWGALLNGGRLAVYPPGAFSLSDLGEFIERERVTTAWLTAGLFHQMIDEHPARLRNLRQLLAGGDVLSPTHVARAREQLPDTKLINGYGPTENTTFTCCHPIAAVPAKRPIPIGRPIANTEVYILDALLQPVPIGVPGELYTGGAGLARGYLNRPELTQEKFVPNPFFAAGAAPRQGWTPAPRLYRTGDCVRWLTDGTIEFLGRIDRQVKIRGFRVEPAEVETVLASHPDVKACAVIVAGNADLKRLVAYVVSHNQPAPAADVWRTFLAQRLPEHLVPAAFVALERLPLTPNGKLDLRALPNDDGARPETGGAYVAPRNEVEKKLAAIWEEVLNVRPIGVHDRFFDLGGHSLLAARMMSQTERQFGRKIPLSFLFRAPTIAGIAEVLREHTPITTSSSLVEIQPRGTEPPIFWLHTLGGGGGAGLFTYQKLAQHLGSNQPSYGLVAPAERASERAPKFEAMAAYYIREMRHVQPTGPYYVGGYCFGGVLAYEMARQLHAAGASVGRVILLDSFPPNPPNIPGRVSFSFAVHLMLTTPSWMFAGLRDPRELVRRIRRAGRRIVRRAETAVGAPEVGSSRQLAELVDMEHYPPEYKALAEVHWRAMVSYMPQPFPGRVALFRPNRPRLLTFSPEFQWRRLAKDVDVTVVSGTHEDILEDPQAGEVAHKLNALLKRDRAGR